MDLEGHVRGAPKIFGIRMTGVGHGRQRAAFREQPAAAGETDPALAMISGGFSAAHQTLRVKRFSALKSWAVRLAGRKGFTTAAVATARKIAVLLPTIWKSGTRFEWKTEVATP